MALYKCIIVIIIIIIQLNNIRPRLDLHFIIWPQLDLINQLFVLTTVISADSASCEFAIISSLGNDTILYTLIIHVTDTLSSCLMMERIMKPTCTTLNMCLIYFRIKYFAHSNSARREAIPPNLEFPFRVTSTLFVVLAVSIMIVGCTSIPVTLPTF